MRTWWQMPFPTYWGRREAQQEVEESWCKRISCNVEGVYTIGLCISRFLSEKVYPTWTWKIGIETHRQILWGHPIKKIGQERVHREVLSKSVRFMSVVLARRNSRKYHMRRHCSKNDAPAKQRGFWRKMFTNSRIRTKLRAIQLLKKGCRHPLRKDQRRENS